jgi:phosphoketolase
MAKASPTTGRNGRTHQRQPSKDGKANSSPRFVRVIFPKDATAQQMADALNELRARHGFK